MFLAMVLRSRTPSGKVLPSNVTSSGMNQAQKWPTEQSIVLAGFHSNERIIFGKKVILGCPSNYLLFNLLKFYDLCTSYWKIMEKLCWARYQFFVIL